MLTPLEKLQALRASGAIDQADFEALAAPHLTAATGTLSVARDNHGLMNSGHLQVDQLTLVLQRAQGPEASAQAQRHGYLARLLMRCDVDVLMGGDDDAHQLKLRSLYIPLLTSMRRAPQSVRPHPGTEGNPDEAPPLSALEVLDEHRRTVLLGGPGSGKSSFAHRMVACMAAELLGQPGDDLGLSPLRAPMPEEDQPRYGRAPKAPALQAWRHGALLPVLVVLRELAAHPRPQGRGPAPGADWIWSHLQAQLQRDGLQTYLPLLRAHLLEQGGLLVLDGLDEVSDANALREDLRAAVQSFTDALPHCRVLVTSRPYAYQQRRWQLHGHMVADLAHLNRAQVALFAQRWYALKTAPGQLSQAEAERCRDSLLDEFDRNPRFAQLAVEPLLLTLIAQVQTASKGELPRQRHVLYERTVKLLLNQWERTKRVLDAHGREVQQESMSEFLRIGPDALRNNLERMAFEAHRDQTLAAAPEPEPEPAKGNAAQTAVTRDMPEAGPPPCADISRERLFGALLHQVADREAKVLHLADYLRDRAGLLAQHDDLGEVFRFPHRTFQEYLAACHLCRQDDWQDLMANLVAQDPGRWREVLLLAATRAHATVSIWGLVDALCPRPPTADAVPDPSPVAWSALLAGQALCECVPAEAMPGPQDRQQPKHQRLQSWQMALLADSRLPARERALAGRNLAQLGDPHVAIMTLDAMPFAWVPAGPFTMGDSTWSNSKPVHRCHLDQPFAIAVYPLSTAQWRAYVLASGHPPTDEDSLTGDANQPARYITWHEARGLCAWLTRRWVSWLPDGWVVDLPSEAEWEKAARGAAEIPAQPRLCALREIAGIATEAGPAAATLTNPTPDRAYPWGHAFHPEHANVGGLIGQASALGAFSLGQSPYGVQEQAGNVWEWTRSLWGTDVSKPAHAYPYEADDGAREDPDAPGDVMRVVRGGGFLNGPHGARCGVRDLNHPGGRDFDLGFRLVVRRSPV